MLLVAALEVHAATLTWDASGTASTTSTATDGSGPWNTSTANWNNNTSNQVWDNAAGDTAVIGNNNGAAGILLLTTPITADRLIFNAPTSGSYTLLGSSLILSGAISRITTNADATIASQLSSVGTLDKDGAGTLTLSSSGSTAGAVSVLNGTLVLQNTIGTPSITIASGAILDINVASGAQSWQGGTVTFSGTGTVRKTGAGDISWGLATNDGIFALGSGSLIDVQEGTFTGGANRGEDWTANLSNLNVASGAIFAGVEANVRVDALTGGGLIRSGYPGAGYSAFTFGVDNGSGIFDGVLSNDVGAGNFIKDGSGTQVLAGTNTYTGTTTITGGTLQLGNGGTSGSILGNVTDNAALVFERSDVSSFAGGISGTGVVVQSGTGTTALTGTNTYTGGTSVSAGTLQLGDGGTSGSIVGDVTNNAALAFNRSDVSSFTGVISGTGTVAQVGAGQTTLTGTNTYTGPTTVAAGSLYVNGDQSGATGLTSVASGATLGGTGTLGSNVSVSDGATLSPGAPGATPGQLSINGNLGLSAGSLLNYRFGQAGTVGGPLNDLTTVAGDLTLDGTLNVTTTTGGSFTPGIYRVISYGGALTNNGLALGTTPLPSTLSVQTAVANQVNLVNTTGLSLNYWDGAAGVKNNSTVNGGNGVWQNAGSNDNWTEATGAINAPFSDGAFAIFMAQPGTVLVDNSLGQVTASGMQFASDGYVVGGGAIALNGSPSSIIRVGDGTASGVGYTATINAVLTGASPIEKEDLGTLVLTGNNTYTGGTTINGGVLQVASDGNLGVAAGVLSLDGGTLRTTADIAMARNTTLGSAGGTIETQSGTLTQNGVISGTGALTKTGAGTLTLAAAETYTGGTTVSAGTLQLGEGGTSGSIVGDVTNNGALAFNRSDVSSFAGVISGAGSVIQVGSGTTALVGTNTYTGGTTVSAGTLQLGDGGTSGSIVGNVANNGTLAFNRSDLSTFAGVISGSGAVTQIGSGTTVLSGANTYTGGTRLEGGTLSVAQDVNLGVANAGLEFNGGTLQATTSITMNRSVVFNGQGTFETAPGVILANAGDSVGTGGLQKTGGGELVLTGTNTYTGGTTISAGTLQLGNGGTSGSIVGDVTNNGTLIFNRSDAQAFDGVISGSGSVTKLNSGNLTLTGANTYSGGTGLKGGQITLGNNRALGEGALSMDEGTTLGFSVDGLNVGNAVVLTGTSDPIVDTGTFNETLSGIISGNGALTKAGTGTLILTAPNTYSGLTTVQAGTLQAGAVNTFSAASAHSVGPGATLDTAGFHQNLAALQNAGTVSLLGANAGNTLRVTGAYVGQEGVLKLGTGLSSDGTSVSDRLVLDGPGASASGHTAIQIASLAGLGAATAGNGVEVVSGLNGATTTAQTSQSAFSLVNGHVDAGAFEYRLYAADSQGAGENWYLRSTIPVPPTPEEPTPPGVPTYRPEVPLLSALPAQMQQADLVMLGTFHQRIGDDFGTSASTSSASAADPRQSWARVVSSNLDIKKSGIASPHADTHMSGVQAGTDLIAVDNWRAGVYVGYLKGSADVSGNARGTTGNVGNNDLQSNYLGIYATWMDPNGLYVDSVLQGGRHDYTIHPDINPNVSGKAYSVAASIEVGKPFALAGPWSIEPQAQLIYQETNPDNVHISGAKVSSNGTSGWVGRLGVRLKGDMVTPVGRLLPYTQVNVNHAHFSDSNASFIGPAGATTLKSPNGYDTAELAVGSTLALSASTSLYGELGHQWSLGGDTTISSAVQGTLGVRVNW